MKTWKAEAMVVAGVLAMQLDATGYHPAEIVCSIAVYITFLHAQVADRMQERQALQATPEVECHAKLNRYFMVKEALWIAFFVMTRSYSALSGAILFFLYPFWRRCWRMIKPITKSK